jgi:hypothetical protein
MTTIQEQIAVMQAFADGKEIEFESAIDHSWYTTRAPSWNWSYYNYRVAVPKPRTMTRWFFEDASGNLIPACCSSKKEAETINRYLLPSRKLVPFQMTEIIE